MKNPLSFIRNFFAPKKVITQKAISNALNVPSRQFLKVNNFDNLSSRINFIPNSPKLNDLYTRLDTQFSILRMDLDEAKTIRELDDLLKKVDNSKSLGHSRQFLYASEIQNTMSVNARKIFNDNLQNINQYIDNFRKQVLQKRNNLFKKK